LPGPTATTSPSIGFCLAVVGYDDTTRLTASFSSMRSIRTRAFD